MNESSSRPCAFDGVPLQLSPEERAVLNDLAFRAGVPLPLEPWQNRHGQNLEAYGLCRLTAHPVQFGVSSSRSAVPGLRASCPHIVSVAWLTARGLRAARIGEGHGPRLATLEGEAVAGWRDFRPWSYTPDAVTVQVTGDPRAGAPAPDQPASEESMQDDLKTPSRALVDIGIERARQRAVEGFDARHDDEHADGQLARAAAAYAMHSAVYPLNAGWYSQVLEWLWPWSVQWWKPKDRRRDLVRAGALIVAEIERLDRSAARADAAEPKTTLTDGRPVTPDHREINPATGQQKGYVVLSDEERAKGFVRPVRRHYRHLTCGQVTTMNLALAETYARQPDFYGGTFCAHCRDHFPVGAEGEFIWEPGGEKVGT